MEEVKEYFQIATKNLKTRSLRSWLTILGIVIGVFLIIALLALSEGIKKTVEKQLLALGSEMIFVMPGDLSNPIAMFMGGAKLEKNDIDAIKRTQGVDKVITLSYSALVVRYDEEGKTILLNAFDWKEGREILENYQGWSLKEGTWLVPGKREVIIGSQVETEMFKTPVKVNSEFNIKGRKFKIVGILNSTGSKQDDASIYLDIVPYQDLTGEKKDTAQAAMIKVREGSQVDKVAQDIKESLEKTRKRRVGADVADFSVITSTKMGDIAASILGAIQIAIVGFASIAIIVGGIGIMNTMFTSVRERIREIGIMKAVGATDKAILTIFLFEATIIGFIGGIGGTALGALFAKTLEIYAQFHPLFYLSTAVTPGLILFGLIFSLFVGSVSGFFPAKRAAKLKPVDALRHYE